MNIGLNYPRFIYIELDGYNSEAKKPENVFVNLAVEEKNAPMFEVQDQSQIQSQSNNQEQSNVQSQSNNQNVEIYNCPANARCVIE